MQSKKVRSTRAIEHLVVVLIVVFGTLLQSFPALAYVTGDIATTAEGLNGTHGGQCKVFVNNVVSSATGKSLSGYQQGFANAGAVEVSAANAGRGDIIQITPAGSTDNTAESMMGSTSSTRLHTTIIRGPRNADGTFDVIDSNWGLDEMVQEHTFNPYTWASGSIIKIWRFGTPSNTSNGTDTIGMVDPTTQTFYMRNSNNAGSAQIAVQFGGGGFKPIVGDWDGNGTATVGTVDPTTQTFYLRNSNTSGTADAVVQFGAGGWIPVVGDWDGNGTTTVGMVDPTTQTFYLRNSNTPGTADIVVQFGAGGWIPVVGDWDGV